MNGQRTLRLSFPSRQISRPAAKPAWQAMLAGATVYAVFTASILLLAQRLPDSQFAASLNLIICIAAIGSILFIIPSRLTFFVASLLVGLLYFSLDRINTEKFTLTSFPLTTTDIRAFINNPSGNLMVFGAPTWAHDAVDYAIYAVAGAIVILGLIIVLRFGLLRSLKQAGLISIRTIIAAVALHLINGSAVSAVTNYQAAHPEIPVWDGEGLASLSRSVGILGFLSYSDYIERGDRNSFLTYTPSQAPPSQADIRKSVDKYVNSTTLDGVLPNIVIVHAESTFDPNDVLNLATPVTGSLFYTNPGPARNPRLNFLGPAFVNTIGGGSWISEFEVANGIDSRLFGVAGRYTHSSLSQYANRTFGHYLRDRGYELSVYQIQDKAFYNSDKAYKAYGFNYMYDRSYIGSGNTDTYVMRNALAIPPVDASAPFLKFVILSENHSPHACESWAADKYEDIRLAGQASEGQTCAIKEYVRRTRSTEQAITMAQNFMEIEQKRTGRPYVIAVYGDHQPFTITGTGGKTWNLGLDFNAFRRDASMRKTILEFISSKQDPMRWPTDEPIPLTLISTILSSYVARSVADIYLPENFYELDHCGSDWIGHLAGTSMGYGGLPSELLKGRCKSYEAILAAFQQSNVIGHFEVTRPETIIASAKGATPIPYPKPAKVPTDAANVAVNTTEKASLEHATSIVIDISGTRYGDAPKGNVLVDGVPVGDFVVEDAPDSAAQSFEFSQVVAHFRKLVFRVQGCPKTVEIRFANDAWEGPNKFGDMNIYIRSITVENTDVDTKTVRFEPPGAGGYYQDLLGIWKDGGAIFQVPAHSACQ